MPEPRTITIRLGSMIGILGVIAGLVGGYLIRRDIQVVTQSALVSDVGNLKLESERTNAYMRSLHLWAVRVSVKNGWPEPPAPEQFLHQGDYMAPGLIPEARAGENP